MCHFLAASYRITLFLMNLASLERTLLRRLSATTWHLSLDATLSYRGCNLYLQVANRRLPSRVCVLKFH